MRNYFSPLAVNKTDTLFYGESRNKSVSFKRTVDYISSDRVVLTDFSATDVFLRSYTFLITDTTISVLSSTTNLNEKETIRNKILYNTWLTTQHKEAYYDSRCEDTVKKGADSYWEWELRHQTGLYFDSIVYKGVKTPALMVTYNNYILNQPRPISAKIYYKDFKEKMTFVKGIGLVSITQHGIDKLHSNIVATSLSTNKATKGNFSTHIDLLNN